MSGNKERGIQARERILNVIIAYIEKHGYPPSYQEICEAVGFYSKATVHNHIQKMLETGMLETDATDGTPRAFRVPGYKFVKEDLS